MFCEVDPHQVMTTGNEQVVFYHWVSAGMTALRQWRLLSHRGR